MRDYLRLYAKYVSISIKGQMQFRASFIMMVIGHIVTTGCEFLGIWALFSRFGSLRGWSLPEVALFYGMVNVAFALAEAFGRGFDVFGQVVKSGDFDRVLLRPRATAFQIAAQEVRLIYIGRMIQGATVLIWACTALNVTWTPLKLMLIPATILGGAFLFMGIFILQATLAFWTIESLEIMNTLTYGGTETAQYPLPIYSPWFRRFFTFVVPLACVNYLPAQVILNHADCVVAPVWSWLAPFGGALFLGVSLLFWQIGVRHYSSTGS